MDTRADRFPLFDSLRALAALAVDLLAHRLVRRRAARGRRAAPVRGPVRGRGPDLPADLGLSALPPVRRGPAARQADALDQGLRLAPRPADRARLLGRAHRDHHLARLELPLPRRRAADRRLLRARGLRPTTASPSSTRRHARRAASRRRGRSTPRSSSTSRSRSTRCSPSGCCAGTDRAGAASSLLLGRDLLLSLLYKLVVVEADDMDDGARHAAAAALVAARLRRPLRARHGACRGQRGRVRRSDASRALVG